MKKFKLFLSLIFSLLFYFRGESQQTTLKFIGDSNKFALSGIGDIQGVKGDNAKLAYWSINSNSNFETKVYLKFLKSGKAGVIIREANATNNFQGVRPCYYLYVESSTLKLKLASRTVENTELALLNTISLTANQNIWLSLKKENNKLTARFSYDAETTENITWTTVATVDNAFGNYTNFVRGVVVASGSKVNSNSAIFTNWKERTVTAPSVLCGITHGTLLATKNGYKAYARIYDNKLWVCVVINEQGDQFAVKGVNWLSDATKTYTGSYSCFEGQNTGFWGNVEPTGFNVPVGYKVTVTADLAKIYSVGTNTVVNAPILASTPSTVIDGTSVAFNVSNCTGTNAIYKNGNVVSNSSFLTVANPTVNDVYSAKCIVSGIESPLSNEILVMSRVTDGSGGGTIGLLADLTLPTITKWNYFNPDDIPDFTIPKIYDTKTSSYLPAKWFIWHTPYTNLFGNTVTERVTKMLKKGVTAINGSVIAKMGGYVQGLENILTFDKVTGDAGLAGSDPGEETYNAFEAWGRSGFGYANTYKVPTTNGKSNIFLNIQDYEGIHSGLSSQTSANYHAVGLYAGLSQTNGRVAFQYGAGKSSGAYATSRLYTNESNNVWSLSADNSVPSAYIGKSASGSNRITACVEMAYTYETLQPQSKVLKDQHGNDWITINHFGNECDNTYGYNSVTNAEHWATQLGSHVETFYQYHKNYNQDLIIQIKPTNERDNGFHYSAVHPEWSDNKWLQDYNRYGITYIEPACNCEIASALGSEYITPFIAEGQVMLSYFQGAKGLNWWSSDFKDDAIPRDKAGNPRRGAKYNDPSYGNRDLEAYLYTLKALYRLSVPVTLSDGRALSFYEIADDNAVYLNQATKVIYSNSNNVTQLRALDWQLLKRSPVRAVVNNEKNVVFVIAFQAYGVEDNQVRFIYNENGANINEVIDIPVGKIIVKAFPLRSTTGSIPPVSAPSITSTSKLKGTTGIFTASGCSGNIAWYKNDVNVSNNTSLTVNNLTINDVFNATCTFNSVTSTKSNSITIEQGSEQIILVFAGESNATPQNDANTALSSEYGLRSNIKVWNSNSNVLEQMNIPVNTTLNQNTGSLNNSWGWELAFANLVRDNIIPKDIIIVQTAQAGSLFGQYNTNANDGYWNQLQTKINNVKNAVISQGKIPKFKIIYSHGLNNVINSISSDNTNFPNLTGQNYYQAAMTSIINNIRSITSDDAPVCITKFWDNYGTILNPVIDNIIALNSSINFSVVTSDLERVAPHNIHIGASGTKTIAYRIAEKFNFFFNQSVNTGNVTITEPNKVSNYYKSSNGNPDIISRYYLNFDDNVYLENNHIRVGISLRGGGAITYFSKAGQNLNFVNNANDGGIGRQIQPDYYQKPSNFSIAGKTTSVHFPNNGYNTTLGGDDFRNVPTLLDYHAITNGYYVKFKPLIWGIDGHISEITMEVTYKLEGNVLRADYSYTSERTDNQRFVPTEGQLSFDGWSIPTLHVNKFWNKIHTYGRLPDQNNSQSITQDLPTNAKNTTTPSFCNLYPTEGWIAIEAPEQNLTLGIINKQISYVRAERKNIINNNLADDKDDAVTIVELLASPQSVDTNLKRIRNDSVYFVLGNVSDVITKANNILN